MNDSKLNSHALLHRRHFIKTFTFAAASSTLFGQPWKGIFAAEITPQAASTLGTLRLKLSDFPALLNESGSVRLGVNPLKGGPPSGPTPDGSFYPVIINRGANNTFYALSSRCPHQGCTVNPMDFSNEITCPCHGSFFAIDGKRLGGPAPGPLAKYTISFDGQDTLEVKVPSLGYSVAASHVQGGGTGSSLLRLAFRAFKNAEYEVHFRESLDQEPSTIPFATSPEGPVEQKVFTSTSATNVNLFVERNAAAGFYHVAVRVAEIF